MNSIMVTSIIAAVDLDFAHSHSVMDALPHLGGMLMVLITLACLWGITVLMSKLVSVFHTLQPSAPAVAATSAAPKPDTTRPAPAHDGISPEIVAIISAAIACMDGGKRRVISIKPADTSWEKAGRQSVLKSHRIR